MRTLYGEQSATLAADQRIHWARARDISEGNPKLQSIVQAGAEKAIDGHGRPYCDGDETRPITHGMFFHSYQHERKFETIA